MARESARDIDRRSGTAGVPAGARGGFGAAWIGGPLCAAAAGDVGLTVLAIVIYTRMSRWMWDEFGVPAVNHALVLLVVAALAGRRLIEGRRFTGWARPLAYLAPYGLTWLVASLPVTDTAGFAANLIRFGQGVALVMIVACMMNGERTLRWLTGGLLAAGAVMCTITVAQQLTATFDRDFFGLEQGSFMIVFDDVWRYRSGGPIGDPNYYAQVLVVLVPLALERLWSRTGDRGAVMYAWAFTAGVLAILFTYSRGGFLGLLAVAGCMSVVAIRRRLRPRALVTTLVLVAVCWLLAPAEYADRIRTLRVLTPWTAQPAAEDAADVGGERFRAGDREGAGVGIRFRGDRWSENRVGWHMFTRSPLLGVGPGNFEARYEYHARALGLDDGRGSRGAHNLYVEVAAETGIVGLAGFCLFLGAMFTTMFRACAALVCRDRVDDARMIMALAVGMVGYLVAALFLHLNVDLVFWLFVGVGFGSLNLAGHGDRSPGRGSCRTAA